jgi:hypothetical protein
MTRKETTKTKKVNFPIKKAGKKAKPIVKELLTSEPVSQPQEPPPVIFKIDNLQSQYEHLNKMLLVSNIIATIALSAFAILLLKRRTSTRLSVKPIVMKQPSNFDLEVKGHGFGGPTGIA